MYWLVPGWKSEIIAWLILADHFTSSFLLDTTSLQDSFGPSVHDPGLLLIPGWLTAESAKNKKLRKYNGMMGGHDVQTKKETEHGYLIESTNPG